MWTHSLAQEGTLSTIRCGNVTYVLVTNITGSSVTLKSGVLIGSFEVADSLSFQDPPHLVAVVSDDTATSNDPVDLITQLDSCANVSDFPDPKPSLLILFVNYKSALALPGESLGVTELPTILLSNLMHALLMFLLIVCRIVSDPL